MNIFYKKIYQSIGLFLGRFYAFFKSFLGQTEWG